jgi:hypothetical protein
MALATLATAGGREFEIAYAGMISAQFPARVLTGINSSATGIDFGVAIAATGAAAPAAGTDQQVKPWAADGDRYAGISVRNAIVAPSSVAGVVSYAQYQNVPYLIEGCIWVQVAEAVREGDEGLIITAGGAGNATAGAFASSKGGVATTGRIVLLNSKYLDTVASGALARLLVQGLGVRGRVTT